MGVNVEKSSGGRTVPQKTVQVTDVQMMLPASKASGNLTVLENREPHLQLVLEEQQLIAFALQLLPEDYDFLSLVFNKLAQALPANLPLISPLHGSSPFSPCWNLATHRAPYEGQGHPQVVDFLDLWRQLAIQLVPSSLNFFVDLPHKIPQKRSAPM